MEAQPTQGYVNISLAIIDTHVKVGVYLKGPCTQA